MQRPPKTFIAVLAAWDTAWKAAAVWTAIRNRQYRWVVPLAIANTAGILPIVYLTRFAHPSEQAPE